MTHQYVPEAGDIVWLHTDPLAVLERPTLVVSPSSYNGKTGLMLCCPMTTKIKGYPFEVKVVGVRSSAALADQVKTLDWMARKATRKGAVSPSELAEVRAKILALIAKP